MRFVTFQSREVTNHLIQKGIVRTEIPFSQPKPHAISAGLEPIITVKHTKLYPFYVYSDHSICGTRYNLSVQTINLLSSYLFGYMGFAERDIIELEVPSDVNYGLKIDDHATICHLPELRLDWVVSILKFKKYVTEPMHYENALLYTNDVLKEDTYHMCYSSSVVFAGHGRGDNIECCLSPVMLPNVQRYDIQRDYVQTNINILFRKYRYLSRNNLPLEEIINVTSKDIRNDNPMLIPVEQIKTFNKFLPKILELTGVWVGYNNLSYKERMELIIAED